MISLEKNNIDKVFKELEIMNSNPEYNLLSKNKRTVTISDIKAEYAKTKISKMNRMLIKKGLQYIGLIDFTLKSSLDNLPKVDLFVIHKKFQGSTIAEQAYYYFEGMLYGNKTNACRLVVCKRNEAAVRFWKKVGYKTYEETIRNGKVCLFMEKRY
ncbi:GNAT family N-acetyltransferase [Terribacillus saccharophilus]|uniref:GNAT family N-acetyltransferase n=1 Tax=Terribacillus saccharophilus TaxID=361277 RepID=UPI003981EC4D